ncbi:MAG: class I SAM-dependent methyltransferase [Muribaculaceae bacterium]|nr:class I SAM-dependent methyltransferase [Muribaculaceae bacterium]
MVNSLIDEYIHSQHIMAWLCSRPKCDFASLMLAAGSDELKRFAAVQVECKRKGARKIPLMADNSHVVFPTLLSVEQCTSELLAEYHASLVPAYSRIADLTSGLGVDVMAMSRRVSSVTAVEREPIVADALRHNTAAMGCENVRVVCADCRDWLKTCEETYDVIFIDPARRDSTGGRVYNMADCEPDIVSMMPDMLAHAHKVIIKASPMYDAVKATHELDGYVSHIRLVGTKTECKELLITCCNSPEPGPVFEAVTIADGKYHTFSWHADDAASASATYGKPAVGMSLYEPWPSVMNGGAFTLLSERFGIAKIAPNTHLYISTEFVPEFPGHAYVIERVEDFSKKAIKEVAKEHDRINVATRNFIMSAPELEKRLKIKSGGDHKLYGVRDSDGHPILLTVR